MKITLSKAMYLCGAICFALATFEVTAVPFVALGLTFVAVGLLTA